MPRQRKQSSVGISARVIALQLAFTLNDASGLTFPPSFLWLNSCTSLCVQPCILMAYKVILMSSASTLSCPAKVSWIWLSTETYRSLVNLCFGEGERQDTPCRNGVVIWNGRILLRWTGKSCVPVESCYGVTVEAVSVHNHIAGCLLFSEMLALP